MKKQNSNVSSCNNTASTTISSALDYVKELYKTLINNLKQVQTQIATINANNSQLTKLQTNFVNEFSIQIDDVDSIMNQTINGMVWDNLVIAFFGETNAGKSTTIETLRILFDKNKQQGTDGLIVGDGQADFTKSYAEYHLSILGKPFTLIDVPGIEGKEEDFQGDIKRALQQAHLVFYVQGHNKKPDSATATKIKKYLNDWVNVYSIYNIRGAVGQYETEAQRKKLLTEKIDKISTSIEKTFLEMLADVYKGNIPVQGLLALCSQANFSDSRKDFINTQQKLITSFGTKEDTYKFSNFDKIVECIRNKTEHFDEELIAANKQKIVALCNQIVTKLIRYGQEKGDDTIRLINSLKLYKNDIKSSVSKAESIRYNILSTNEQLFSTLQKQMCDIIDESGSSDEKEKKIISKVKFFRGIYSYTMHKVFNDEITKLNESLKDKQKKYLDCFKDYSLTDFTYNLSIQELKMDDITDELKFTSKDLFKSIMSLGGAIAGGAAAGSFGGPAGALTGALTAAAIWSVKGLINDVNSDESKKRAKEEIQKQIGEAKEKINSAIEQETKKVNLQIAQQTNKIMNKIDEDLKYIETIKTSIDQCQKQIETFTLQNLKK